MKAIAVLAGLVLALSAAEVDGLREFHGEIADSSCALNVHSVSRSHKEMLKSRYMGTTAADCAHYCVRNLGSNFVLVSGKDVYKLERQGVAEPFAGKAVIVKGKLDSKNNVINVNSIEAVHSTTSTP